jgi:hypothetical protein
MISQAEVQRKYETLMNDVATKDYYKIDLTNRVNCYKCKCGHITKTKDIDAGVTPMMFNCESCDGTAMSTFFTDVAPHQNPTIEWYRPTIDELLKMRNKPELVDHVLQGGLCHRKIENVKETNGYSEIIDDMFKKVSKPGRNEPCPCGSGKKYKHCHLKEKV